MKRRNTAGIFFVIIGTLLALCQLTPVGADPGQAPPAEPVLAGQPNPDDVYTCCGLGRIDYLNVAEARMLETGEVLWRYQTAPGCEGLDVGLKEIIIESQALWTAELGVRFREDPSGWQYVGNCGASWKALCPGAVGCLAFNWPTNGRVDFDAPTLLSYAFRESKVAVVTHEICHQILTCEEQYAKQNGIACVPGWRDFMNCGPDSRHGFEHVEKERCKRICYPPPAVSNGYGFNGSWYVYACGFDLVRAKRLSVLVDRHDGRGIVWAGVFPKLAPDGRGCQGVGPFDGLAIEVGADYFVKPESVLSASKWYNETCVRGSRACP